MHTNNTENDTKQTTHRTTQKLGRVRTVPRLCGFYPGICLATEEKARKNISQGSLDKHTIRIHSHNNKITLITLLNRNEAMKRPKHVVIETSYVKTL